MDTKTLRRMLEDLYARYNRRRFVRPDPLEFLYDYNRQVDREIVGMIASCLAYGRVAQILASVSRILAPVKRPALFLSEASENELRKTYGDFRHRFNTGDDIASLMVGLKRVLAEYKTLQNCFAAGYSETDETVIPALTQFVAELSGKMQHKPKFLLPDPRKGSACKRILLFLRWMVRKDDVDPGGWTDIPASKLVIPLDTHMFKIAGKLGFTARRQANLRTALEITERFRQIAPDDPVKYDFALTRYGIRNELDISSIPKHSDR